MVTENETMLIPVSGFPQEVRKLWETPSLGRIKIVLDALFPDQATVVFAEIGVWRGEHAQAILQYCPRVRYFGVDPWETIIDLPEDGRHVTSRQNFTTSKHREENRTHTESILSPWLKTGQAELFVGDSIKATELFPDGHFDIVYIDGNHGQRAVEMDFKAWVPKVRPGGVFAGHDYRFAIGVRETVEEFAKKHGLEVIHRRCSDEWMIGPFPERLKRW